jgi:hypothetical protein
VRDVDLVHKDGRPVTTLNGWIIISLNEHHHRRGLEALVEREMRVAERRLHIDLTFDGPRGRPTELTSEDIHDVEERLRKSTQSGLVQCLRINPCMRQYSCI